MDNISYTLSWLQYSQDDMLKNPKWWFHHWTHKNYSGGLTGWEDYMSNVYFRPSTYEERLLQGEVHQVMLMALRCAMTRAKKSPTDSLNVAEAYRIARMVARVDPLVAAATKVHLNKLCRKLKERKSLLEEAERGFGVLIYTSPERCLTW